MEMKRAWGNIPFEVVNDGEVTALAGSMNLGRPAVLGIAMGTNQAAGFVTPEGQITSWLNELAFAPIDYRDGAPRDEWSGMAAVFGFFTAGSGDSFPDQVGNRPFFAVSRTTGCGADLHGKGG